MSNFDSQFPTYDDPFVVVDGEVRSKWVPIAGKGSDAVCGKDLGVEMAYAGDALSQSPAGNVYWTLAGLHTYDGVCIARNLGEATQILLEDGWVSGNGIHWGLFSNRSDAERSEILQAAAKKLRFLED